MATSPDKFRPQSPPEVLLRKLLPELFDAHQLQPPTTSVIASEFFELVRSLAESLLPKRPTFGRPTPHEVASELAMLLLSGRLGRKFDPSRNAEAYLTRTIKLIARWFDRKHRARNRVSLSLTPSIVAVEGRDRRLGVAERELFARAYELLPNLTQKRRDAIASVLSETSGDSEAARSCKTKAVHKHRGLRQLRRMLAELGIHEL